jgi:hypothetical protein
MTTLFPLHVGLYLDATARGDVEASLASFAPSATVIDEGHSYTAAAIRAWRERASTEFTFTSDFLGLEPTDESHFVARFHLEGDFPGGTVDLRFLFTLAPSGLIERLEITP